MKRMSYLSYILVVVLILVAVGVLFRGGVTDKNAAAIAFATAADQEAQDFIATINGENIGREYYTISYRLHQAKSPDAETDTLLAQTSAEIEDQMAYLLYAQSSALLPTEDEAQAYYDGQRSAFAADEEADAQMRALCEQLGIEEDLMWQYNRLQAVFTVTKSKVDAYIEENELQPFDSDGLTVEFTDEDFVRSLTEGQ